MGTRSTTTFNKIDEWEDSKGQKHKETIHLVTCYKQFDGYPSGYGLELANFLASGVLVNGFGDSKILQFNGMGCLAAQVIALFKDGVGGYYIEPEGCSLEQFNYTVYNKGDKVFLRCEDYDNELLFEGEPKDFAEFVEKFEQAN
jgi:hypothetical protein